MKTHFKKLTNPNYIGSHDLLDEKGNKIEITVTISKIQKELLNSAEGKQGECVVCYFQGAKKPMVLNKTNMKIIRNLHGTPFIEEWIGKKVTLMSVKVKAFGEMVDAIRIKSV